ncbi:hypothetical protein FL857_10795 [Criibacterium bergeronii]|uniref:Uncharacterized protein n=1 Tax=Criibacterium bergeronii TaxID=1871336 RepID=A0A552UXF5_9FIRM|nr:hypothetical protein [Criibacterium bergeronii]TRW22889.1 hypothetical protein FL857_10795 [Criibacterium bergeronii]
MIFAKAYNVTVLQPRQKKGKSKIVCVFRTGKKQIDEKGKLVYYYDDFHGEFVAEAFEKAKTLKNRDRINITKSFMIVEINGVSRLKVLEFEMSKYQTMTQEQELKYLDKILTPERLKFM